MTEIRPALRRATSVQPSRDASTEPALDSVELSYDDRCRRRIRLRTLAGMDVLLDLPQVTELHDGDQLCLDGGGRITVRAAPEALMEAVPQDPATLPRVAWHVGNRHLPAQILSDRLVLRDDHVIAQMLRGLGCTVTPCEGPFTPEGGAYGTGRTHGHAH